MNNIKEMLELCKKYYSKEKLEHTKRVALHVPVIGKLFSPRQKDWDGVICLALAHDLYEDTAIERGKYFDDKFERNLLLLTRDKNTKYTNYISNIRAAALADENYLAAYIVKLADMWDHLNQTETLTDKRKEKYIKALPYLL